MDKNELFPQVLPTAISRDGSLLHIIFLNILNDLSSETSTEIFLRDGAPRVLLYLFLPLL